MTERTEIKSRRRSRVVIIGAGFGGLWAARAFTHSPVEVMLLDRNNYHTFFPLLYQVAAAELEPEDIVYPVRSLARNLRHTDFCLAEVQSIDFANHAVATQKFSIPYDFLIISTGSVTHFFDVPGAKQYSFPLKTLDQAVTLRNQILYSFERAIHERDPNRRRRLLTFTIVGGGPTGVEFAGALVELIRGPLFKDFRRLDFHEVRVVLLEAMGNLLSGLPERLSAYALKRLHRMGVDVQLQATVNEITPQSLKLKNGTVIPTETVVWTAGVRGDPIAQSLHLPVGRNGRVRVLPTLQLAGHPDVYIIGDLVHAEEGGQLLPMLAPVAMQQGTAAARNISRQIEGLDPLPFQYRDPGTMATIGRHAAVATIGGRMFTGFPAWIVWLSVHLYKLIGFRNRLVVLINWAWDYFFYERAVRLILPTMQSRIPDERAESAPVSATRMNIYQ
ncbi:MAG: NAD(P)/FAD-dependent oxidoreductase [Ignavibacteriae bacterium]|nr:MAG: NAD(P)/FAD-dependent oxidoreductase [Ignavibacteriota bacterium]